MFTKFVSEAGSRSKEAFITVNANGQGMLSAKACSEIGIDGNTGVNLYFDEATKEVAIEHDKEKGTTSVIKVTKGGARFAMGSFCSKYGIPTPVKIELKTIREPFTGLCGKVEEKK